MLDRMFNAPIPGQSLTAEPKSRPYETPPQFTDLDEALVDTIEGMANEEVAPRILQMLEVGLPVSAIVQGVIMGGFTEGKWTPDVGMLMTKPLSAFLFKMAEVAGIEVKATKEGKREIDKLLMQVVNKREAVDQFTASQAAKEAKKSVPQLGILAGKDDDVEDDLEEDDSMDDMGIPPETINS